MKQFTDGVEGVFYEVADADYRKAPGVSNSMLKHLAPNGEEPGSPAHFKVSLSEPSEDTDAMFFGRMVHARILTPGCELPNVEIIPKKYPAPADCSLVKEKKCAPGDLIKWSGNANYCKNWIDEREAKGIWAITEEDLENMNGEVNAIATHPVAMAALKAGRPEVSLFKQYWHGSRMLMKKARLDWVSSGSALVDIKTCQDARREKFSKEMYKRRYFVQAAYYLDIWNELNPDDQKTNFVFICVEKFAPFAVSIFDFLPKAIAAGRGEYRDNLNLLLTCIELDEWPAYSPDPQLLDLPDYAYKKGLELHV